MKRLALKVVPVVAVFFAAVALASHVEPAKANKFTFSLVNGYFPCSTPNTATQSAGFPACAPTGLLGCGFSPTGAGTLTFVVTGNASKDTRDIKLAAVAQRPRV